MGATTAKAGMKIIVINAGSSTYKSAVFQLQKISKKPQYPLWSGIVDFDQTGKQNPAQAVHEMLEKCPYLKGDFSPLIGHRIVHGGTEFSHPVFIDGKVKRAIEKLIPLAPLHNPANLLGIQIMESLFPRGKNIAVFDTAFHTTLPEEAFTYPIPKAWRKKKVRRYGFHGISHQYCAHRASVLLRRDLKKLRIITCHLGNGASLAAVRGGICIDTTMGFTPLEGLMMGTRSGSIDPSIPLFMQSEFALNFSEAEKILNEQSGLKGICGYSDFRKVLKLKKTGNAEAHLAFDMYVHSLKRYIGAMAGSLGGVDCLVFTGGVGENSAELREAVCEAYSWLGIVLDKTKNEDGLPDTLISHKRSKMEVLLIHTREDWAIAQSCFKLAAQ